MLRIVRFTFSDPGSTSPHPWSDSDLRNWLDDTIPFSMANYWKAVSFGEASLAFDILSSVAVTRPNPPLVDGPSREAFVETVADAVEAAQANVAWNNGDILVAIGAENPGQNFGGQSSLVRTGPDDSTKVTLGVVFISLDTGFDMMAEEVGHAFGFHHGVDAAGNDYCDRYCFMSSDNYGGTSPKFSRPKDPRLPVAIRPDGTDAQRIVGPMLSASQLYFGPWAANVQAKGLFTELTPSDVANGTTITLNALDAAVDGFPGSILPIAVSIPSPTNDNRYTVELRRHAGLDLGISEIGTDLSGVPTAIVIYHWANIATLTPRDHVMMAAFLPLYPEMLDRDITIAGLNGNNFGVRVTSLSGDASTVRLYIAEARRFSAVSLDLELIDEVLASKREFPVARRLVRPCIFVPARDYSYSVLYETHHFSVFADASNFQLPSIRITVEGKILVADGNYHDIEFNVRMATPQLGEPTKSEMQRITARYIMKGNTARILYDTLAAPLERRGNFALSVVCTVDEAAPGTTTFDSRTVNTTLIFTNMTIDAGAAYRSAAKACDALIAHINVRPRIPLNRTGFAGGSNF
ncbi:hypothetical protein LVY75_04935 (plasmid) [Sinorhizobium sp. B11]